MTFLMNVVEVSNEGHGLDSYSLSIWRRVYLPVGERTANFNMELIFISDFKKVASFKETVVLLGRFNFYIFFLEGVESD